MIKEFPSTFISMWLKDLKARKKLCLVPVQHFPDASRTVAIFHSDNVTPEQLNAAKYRGLGTRQQLACFEHAEVYIAVCFVLPNERELLSTLEPQFIKSNTFVQQFWVTINS